MKLTENLYAYIWKGSDNNCNSYLFANILSDKKHILVDPGHIITPYLGEPAFEILVKEIEKDGLRIEDIGLILLTHAHEDHVESAWKFKERSGALIALHKDEVSLNQMFGGGKIDLQLEEGELKLSKPLIDKVEILKTPGHSSGEISIYWPAKKALAVGDVVFFRSTGRVDLPGGSAEMLKKSIERLSTLDVQYLLCGHAYGHPGVFQDKEAIRQNFEFIKEEFWF